VERVIVSGQPRRRAVLLAAVLGALALLVAGCGTLGYTGANADKTNGKKLFIAKCGACHTLADAGTTGTIGPDLDAAFKQALAVGMTEDTVRQVVRGQIAYAITDTSTGSPGMPKNLVTGDDARDVAAYVASVAGKPAATAAPAPAQAPPTTTSAAATTTATTAAPTAGAPDAATIALGRKVFAASTCGGCHTLKDAGASATVGPNLDKLAADAKTAGKALDAYVRESIVNPAAYVVPGFQNVMTSTFGQTLKPAELKALIAYLLAVSGK
jgi:mono/diheme cytochrome c family protein